MSLHNASSQELLLSILDSLRADSTQVSTIVRQDSCDYFDNMANHRNFQFRDNDMVHLKSYKDYSMYLMVYPQGLLSDSIPYPNFRDWGVKLAVLFDRKLQRCYFFKYSMTLRFFFENKEKNTALIDAEFSRNIQDIVELDNHFNPLWGVYIFVIRDQVGSSIANLGDLGTYFTFSSYQNNTYFKSKGIFKKNLNIATITYQELSDRFDISEFDNDIINSPVGKMDSDRLFTGSLPGF